MSAEENLANQRRVWEEAFGKGNLEVIDAVAKVIPGFDAGEARIVWIKNTLQLGEMMISEAMIPVTEAIENVQICAAPVPMEFDQSGNLVSW